MYREVNSIVSESNRSYQNDVKDGHRFVKEKNRRYGLKDKQVKSKYNYERKIKPEFSFNKQDMFVSYRIWNMLWPIIKDMYWKVQKGLVFWFAMQVYGHPWEQSVLRMLENFDIKFALSKPTCAKVFGLFSKFFRKLRDCSHLVGFKGG